MRTIATDRQSLHALKSVLPILVFGSHYAEAGGPLSALVDKAYDNLVALQDLLVARMGSDDSMPTFVSRRRPASQQELVRSLELSIGHALIHEPCSGEVQRELVSIYLALFAFRVRGLQ
ncbi:MAG: hypothetical protein Q8M77_01835 [Hydrogenophaga sp.]|nr:hypothetical protein [Hydrogenophaga sp.]